MTSTKDSEYTSRLLAQTSWWKRLLDVQWPYRLHLRRLKLGHTLDIGCGIGRNLINIGKSGHAVGIDHNPHSVEVARSMGLAAFTPEEFHSSSYSSPSAYDSLLLSHVAEHMPRGEVVSLLNEYLHYLRVGGRVVLITPQEAGYRSDPTHVEFMDFDVLAGILREAGIEVMQQYSYPLPRIVGKVFKYNEFVVIGRKNG